MQTSFLLCYHHFTEKSKDMEYYIASPTYEMVNWEKFIKLKRKEQLSYLNEKNINWDLPPEDVTIKVINCSLLLNDSIPILKKKLRCAAPFLDDHRIDDCGMHLWVTYNETVSLRNWFSIYLELINKDKDHINTTDIENWSSRNMYKKLLTTPTNLEEWLEICGKFDRVLGRSANPYITANPVNIKKMTLKDNDTGSWDNSKYNKIVNSAFYEYGNPREYNQTIHIITVINFIEYFRTELNSEKINQAIYYREFFHRYGDIKPRQDSGRASIIDANNIREWTTDDINKLKKYFYIESDRLNSLYSHTHNSNISLRLHSICIDINYSEPKPWIDQKRVFQIFEPTRQIPFLKLGTADSSIPLYKVFIKEKLSNITDEELQSWTRKTHKDLDSGAGKHYVGLRFQIFITEHNKYFTLLLDQYGQLQLQAGLTDIPFSSINDFYDYMKPIIRECISLVHYLNTLPLRRDLCVNGKINLPSYDPESWIIRNINSVIQFYDFEMPPDSFSVNNDNNLLSNIREIYSPWMFLCIDQNNINKKHTELYSRYIKCSHTYNKNIKTIEKILLDSNVNKADINNMISIITLCKLENNYEIAKNVNIGIETRFNITPNNQLQVDLQGIHSLFELNQIIYDIQSIISWWIHDLTIAAPFSDDSDSDFDDEEISAEIELDLNKRAKKSDSELWDFTVLNSNPNRSNWRGAKFSQKSQGSQAVPYTNDAWNTMLKKMANKSINNGVWDGDDGQILKFRNIRYVCTDKLCKRCNYPFPKHRTGNCPICNASKNDIEKNILKGKEKYNAVFLPKMDDTLAMCFSDKNMINFPVDINHNHEWRRGYLTKACEDTYIYYILDKPIQLSDIPKSLPDIVVWVENYNKTNPLKLYIAKHDEILTGDPMAMDTERVDNLIRIGWPSCQKNKLKKKKT